MSKRVAWMNRPRTWSASRRTLMQRCPRAWALRYGFTRKKTGIFNRHLVDISDWSSPWRLMQRALRGVILERMDSFSKGRDWSDLDLASKIRHRIIGSLSRQKSTLKLIETRLGRPSLLKGDMDSNEIDRLVEIACHRYHRAIQSRPFADILSGKITEWIINSRLEKTKVRQFYAHISPDIAWKSGRTWHLMRLTVQGKSNPGMDIELEQAIMALWGLERQGMPKFAERYVVESLTWSKGKWINWSMPVDDVTLGTALEMICSDMRAMIDLHRRMGPACDLSQLPLAANRRTCRDCGHIDTCPGGEDLKRGRLEQSVLEMANSFSRAN